MNRKTLLWSTGGVLTFCALGAAAFYLFTRIQHNQEVTTLLGQATGQLEQLAHRDPYPSADNINAVQQEQARVQTFLRTVEQHFAPTTCPAVRNNMEFRTYLDETIAQLRTEAARSRVELPADYWFTFAAQKGAMTFSEKSLMPLARQLAEIRSLCEALFDAKVNTLSGLKRAPVETQDTLGSEDYLNMQPLTNRWAVLVPYEIAFQGFSSELAALLERLARAPQCFVVTNLTVEPTVQSGAPGTADNLLPRLLEARHDGHGVLPGYLDRYLTPNRAVPTLRPRPRGSAPVLSEQPLRFVLGVQAIRLR
jgi:hypothetical protein